MPQTSAGILLHRRGAKGREVFLVHPGGPYWVNKDDRAWSIPKGLADSGEDLELAARREFREETGFDAGGDLHPLGAFRLPSGKRVHVWTLERDCDPAGLESNLYQVVWPPRSGQKRFFPEVDRGAWFGRAKALRKIAVGQRQILEHFFSGTT